MNANNPPPSVGSSKRTLTRSLLAVKLLISIGLLTWLFRRIDLGAMGEKFAHIHVGWLLFSLFLLQTQCIISTVKWQFILHADGHPVPFLFLWKTYLISGFLSLFLPTSFGGDVYRVWALNQRGIQASRSTASVLFDRVSGLFALATVGMVGTALLIGGRYDWAIFAIYVIGTAAFLVATSDATLARLPAPRSKWLAFPHRVLQSFNRYRRSPRTLATTLGLSGLFQFNIVLIIACYARALNIPSTDVSFAEMLATVPVVYLTEMLPISINGIGVRDSAFVFFFQKVGGTGEQALAVSLLVIALRYFDGAVGGLLLLADSLRGRRPRIMAIRESPEGGSQAPRPGPRHAPSDKCNGPIAPSDAIE